MKKDSLIEDIQRQRNRQVDRDIGTKLVELLETVAAFYEVCASDELAKACEMKSASAIRKILLQSFRNNQIRKREKQCKH
jgi:hypothetical protein